MSERKNRPSLIAVVNYWIEHAETDWPKLNQRSDWGEPICWRCGWHAQDKNEIVGDPLEKTWKAVDYLERSHLVDHQLGGPFTPDNVALLCHSCNMGMPMFEDKQQAIEWINNTSPAQELLEVLRKVFGDNTSKRTKHALNKMAEEGKRTGGVPYGYQLSADGVSLVEDPSEMELVRTLRDLKAKGYTYKQVAEEMNAGGITTKKGKLWTWRTAQAVICDCKT